MSELKRYSPRHRSMVGDNNGAWHHDEDVHAELQRHKRAIEWLKSNSDFLLTHDASACVTKDGWVDVPSEIADLIKGQP